MRRNIDVLPVIGIFDDLEGNSLDIVKEGGFADSTLTHHENGLGFDLFSNLISSQHTGIDVLGFWLLLHIKYLFIKIYHKLSMYRKNK